MKQRCLVIADDLTGGVDTGAQFAKRGLNTLMIFSKHPDDIDLSQYSNRDVLVVSTDSRGLRPDQAANVVSRSLRTYDEEIFPIVYKKVDSTLRGNIGAEIDVILKETNISMGFMAPSYPELKRRVVGGMMIIGKKPLSLTEASSNTVSPVTESYVYGLIEQQSSRRVAWIDLTHVAADFMELRKSVDQEQEKGSEIIIFDAFRRRDLTHIAEVAFSMDKKPLCIGSAGFAGEVAKKIAPPGSRKILPSPQPETRRFKHIFIISGSMSNVSQRQVSRVEQTTRIDTFQLGKSQILGSRASRQRSESDLSTMIGNSLRRGHAILRTCSERLFSPDSEDPSIHLEIARGLGQATRAALDKSRLGTHDLALIIIGGDTTLGIFDSLGVEGLEIEGEILDGAGVGHLLGGDWQGLKVSTKAGAFGKQNAIEKAFETLKADSN